LEKWQKWLDSLATKGGNLLILGMFVFVTLVLVIWIETKAGGDQNTRAETVILTTFSNFTGALLGAVVNQQRDQRKADTPPAGTHPPLIPNVK
jgi:hypothetical protein